MVSMQDHVTTFPSSIMKGGVCVCVCVTILSLLHKAPSVHLTRGVWNVPFINQAILMSGSWLRRTAHDLPSWESDELENDMALAQWMRERV